MAGHYAAFKRAKERMIAAKEEISTITISGAVGTYPVLPPEVEYVADKLGLKPETVATQVIPRDRHAMFFATLGVVASSIENLAVEIRHLSAPKSARPRNISIPSKKAHRRCRTSATPWLPKT